MKKIFKRLLFLILLILSGSFIIFNILIPLYKHLNPPSVAREFTKEKALEDYDFMWDILDKRYPYKGVAERKLNINVDDVKVKYRKRIEARNNIDIRSFHKIISDAVNELGYVGHLLVFDSKSYYSIKDALTLTEVEIEEYNVKDQVDALNNKRANESYKYLKNGMSFNIINKLYSIRTKSNVITKNIDDKIGYIEIKQPSIKNMDKDREYILNYFKDLESKGYKALIIRMHANNSGDYYWMDNIISPNIDETKTMNIKTFIMDDMFFSYKDEYKDIKLMEEFDFNKYYNANKDDFKNFIGYLDSNISITPSLNQKAFSGDIYLLTDESVYSSIESFAQFSKATGFAKLVGYNTGGDGYNGGTPMMSNLPNSGFIVFYRTGYGINEDGSSNVEYGTRPDFLIDKQKTPFQGCLDLINEEYNR